jgi:hypothetical protein
LFGVSSSGWEHAKPAGHHPQGPGQQPRSRPQDGILRLHALAGNQAVANLLQGAHGPLPLQRYDAFEHATEGDKAAGSRKVTVGAGELPGGTRIGGVELTSGEMNALADLYGNPVISGEPTRSRSPTCWF